MSDCTLLGALPTDWDSEMRSLLGSRLAVSGMPLHDRGKVLVHSMLMLAGGGESCADIEHLRAQEDLFGSGAVGLDGVPGLPRDLAPP